MSTLADLIDGRAWDKVQSRLASHPHEAEEKISRGIEKTLALHEACKLQPPIDVVNALILAYEPAIKTKVELDGYLPLHYAVKSNASPDAVTFLIDKYPFGARAKESTGKLPLHLVCQYGGAPDLVNICLINHPEGIYVKDDDGRKAIDYATKHKCYPNNEAEVVEVLTKRGPWYCAVTKAAISRESERFASKLTNIIGVHAAQVARLHAKHQKEMKNFAQSEESLRSVLDRKSRESELLRDVLEEVKDTHKEDESVAAIVQNNLRADIEAEKNKALGLSGALHALEEDIVNKEIAAAEKATLPLRDENERLRMENEKFKGLKEDNKTLNIQLQRERKLALVIEIAAASNVEKLSDRAAELEKNIAHYEAQLIASNDELEMEKAKVNSLKEDSETLEMQLQRARKVALVQELDKNSASAMVDTLSAHIVQLDNKIAHGEAQMVASNERLEVENGKVNGLKGHNETLKMQLQRARKVALVQELDKNAAASNVEKLSDRVAELDDKIAHDEARLVAHNERLETENATVNGLKEDNETVKMQLQRARKLALVRELESISASSHVEKLLDHVEELDNKIAHDEDQLISSNERLEMANAAVNRLKEDNETLKMQLQAEKKVALVMASSVDDLSDRIAELRKEIAQDEAQLKANDDRLRMKNRKLSSLKEDNKSLTMQLQLEKVSSADRLSSSVAELETKVAYDQEQIRASDKANEKLILQVKNLEDMLKDSKSSINTLETRNTVLEEDLNEAREKYDEHVGKQNAQVRGAIVHSLADWMGASTGQETDSGADSDSSPWVFDWKHDGVQANDSLPLAPKDDEKPLKLAAAVVGQGGGMIDKETISAEEAPGADSVDQRKVELTRRIPPDPIQSTEDSPVRSPVRTIEPSVPSSPFCVGTDLMQMPSFCEVNRRKQKR